MPAPARTLCCCQHQRVLPSEGPGGGALLAWRLGPKGARGLGRPAVPGTRPPPCRVICSGTEAQGEPCDPSGMSVTQQGPKWDMNCSVRGKQERKTAKGQAHPPPQVLFILRLFNGPRSRFPLGSRTEAAPVLCQGPEDEHVSPSAIRSPRQRWALRAQRARTRWPAHKTLLTKAGRGPDQPGARLRHTRCLRGAQRTNEQDTAATQPHLLLTRVRQPRSPRRHCVLPPR